MRGNGTLKVLTQYAGVTFTSSLAGFVKQSLDDIAIWLLVMFTVIVVDLLMSIYKIIKVKDYKLEHNIKIGKQDRIRWSKGIRDTMGKIATYFAFVVAMVFVANASHIDNLEIWGCMAVIFGETLSIVGNWCKAHGLKLNTNKLLNWGMSKATLPDDLITDNDEDTEY